MALLPRWLRLPRPQSFLYLMSLRTGTEMIFLTMIFNKMTGFYGFLAVFAGLQLNPMQLSMYIYSVAALVLIAFLLPHVRKQTPLQCLALAWFYLFDTILNTLYTAAFAITWFLTISSVQRDRSGSIENAPGSGTINDTAGFTSPEYDVSGVEVVATPAAGLSTGQDAVALGAAAATEAVTGNPSVAHGVGLAESMPSIFVIVLLTLLRIYFIFIVMAYARQVLRQQMVSAGPSSRTHFHVDGITDGETVSPFGATSPQGQGWKGRLGRAMTYVAKDYWLGGTNDNEWARNMGRRFRAPKTSEPTDTSERERRARSGTGPPKPPSTLSK
ncbi:MAG: hypothetical protein M1818_001130 [Claussenomyces sp. TS43310]|nr:MAG: hypothetical protein M1818_001130 [Claussenomyces sp. TS43310]